MRLINLIVSCCFSFLFFSPSLLLFLRSFSWSFHLYQSPLYQFIPLPSFPPSHCLPHSKLCDSLRFPGLSTNFELTTSNRGTILHLMRTDPRNRQRRRDSRTTGEVSGRVHSDDPRGADSGLLDLHPKLHDAGAGAMACWDERDTCYQDVPSFGRRGG